MKNALKRLTALIAAAALFIPSYAKGAEVSYDTGAAVEAGVVRYVSQISKNEYYCEDYWGVYAPYSSHECGTACISMALSYVGVDETPKELGDYWIEAGYTAGVPFSTVFGDVPNAVGGHTYDFKKAYENYENGDASPVIIYFTAAVNPYQTGNRHFVMLIEKFEGNEYLAVDPASDSLRRVTVEPTEEGTYIVSTLSKSGEVLTDELTESELSSAQYCANIKTAKEKKVKPEIEKAKEESKTEQSANAQEQPTNTEVKVEEKNDEVPPEAPKKEPVSEVKEASTMPVVDKTPYNKAASRIMAAIIKSIGE